MTREEKQKAIDALKISAPVMVVTQEEFNDYIQTLNKVMNWLEQEPCGDAIDRTEAIRVASGYCHFSNIPKELAKLPPVTPEPKTDVLDKIKGYIDYIRNTGMGKNKSLEFIEKFIEGLKAESEGKE